MGCLLLRWNWNHVSSVQSQIKCYWQLRGDRTAGKHASKTLTIATKHSSCQYLTHLWKIITQVKKRLKCLDPEKFKMQPCFGNIKKPIQGESPCYIQLFGTSSCCTLYQDCRCEKASCRSWGHLFHCRNYPFFFISSRDGIICKLCHPIFSIFKLISGCHHFHLWLN